jgi:hypothetical protein
MKSSQNISFIKYLLLMALVLVLTACQTGGDDGGTIVINTAVPPQATATTTSMATIMPSPTTVVIEATSTATAVSQPATTPQPIRIQFAADATSSRQTGTIQPFVDQEYLLYALAGQIMHIRLTSQSGKVNFSLQGVSDGQPYKRVVNEDRFWDGTLPSSQDYLIRVTTADAPENYTLDVLVEPLPTQPQRIQFAPSAVSASVSGIIEANTNDQYVLGAQAGQVMHIFLAATNGLANFDLVGVSDGVPYKRAIFPPSSWEGFLPMTQDYLINISAPADTADSYTLSVTIDPIAQAPAPERIQFAAGTISATVNGSFVAGGDIRSYILNVGAGQNMTAQVTTNIPAGAGTIFIKDDTGRILSSGTDADLVSINLDRTADYIIVLSSPGAAPALNYTMTVTIP